MVVLNKKIIAGALLFIVFYSVQLPVEASSPPRGNYVPADLDVRGHPFVAELETERRYYEGRLLKEEDEHWQIEVLTPDETITTFIPSERLELPEKLLQAGTPLVLQRSPDDPQRFIFIELNRNYRYLLLLLFGLLTAIIVGGWRTTRSLLGLAVGLTYFFAFLIPRIQAGSPIILEMTLFYFIVALLVLPAALGFNKKAISAVLTTVCTGIIALLVFYAAVHWLSISGLSEEVTHVLDYARRYFPHRLADINLFTLVVGGGLIGILGVVLDVSVDVTSSAAEIASRRPELPFPELVARVTTVSRRLLGTMCNTLLLAYLGTDLLLLFSLYLLPETFRYQLNRELIAVSIVRGLGGALGFLFAVPLAISFYSLLFRPSAEKPPPPNDPQAPTV